ncbi:Outer membrane receptor proteins, mostly Fe transport [Collimonas sp. OK307]|uniref:TonB-dependent receptor n=1 Tax=Collimonas sp. OK307 TaxID=1801620 RepID=UPI0008F22D9C|nr:TonB-dependent receptor plug domain-containing protein [Collimonas sp. OK307]SFI37796.1 Outer membrane receptor proteins, mostly Fe transport [Collimonas sp. OK307]
MNAQINNAVKILILLSSMQAACANAQTSVAGGSDAKPDATDNDASQTTNQSDKQGKSNKVSQTPDNKKNSGVQTVEVVGFAEAVGFSATRANIKITKEDLSYYAPGVSGDKILELVSGIQQGSSSALGGSTFDSTINMRGFEKDSIGFSVDGIPNGRTTLGGGAVPSRYFDSSNLASVQVSQSAGEIGAPSNQALAGQINYVTAEPTDTFGAKAELGYGSADSKRAYVLINTGEIADGLKGYISASKNQSQVSYVSDPSGDNTQSHVDMKVVKEFGNGAELKFRYSYNNIDETSAANIVTLQSFKANPTVDGYTDSWNGKAASDVNYRGFYGNPRTDQLAYIAGSIPVFGNAILDVKVYNARQDGVGKYANLGSAYSALNGSANSIYYRANDYYTDRNGALAELSGSNGNYFAWRVGAWAEQYHANQNRNFYLLTDPTVSQNYSSTSSLTSSDLHWHDSTKLLYAANTSKLLDGKFKIDYGVTFLQSSVDFNAPIYSATSSKASSNKYNYVNQADANSGILPKIGALYSLNSTTQVFAGYAKNAASIGDPTVQANATPASSPGNTINKMDTADAFDFGVRQKGDNHSVALQTFIIRAKQTFASDILSTLTKQNIAEGRNVKGIELNYKQRFGNWTLYAAATVQQCKYDLSNVDANGYSAVGFIRNNADCVGIANKNFFSEITYKPNAALKFAGTVKIKSNMAGYYANPNVANSGVNETVNGVALFGLNMSYKMSGQMVGINVENLTNRHYISGIAPELESSSSASGRYFIGAPRTVFLWYRAEI